MVTMRPNGAVTPDGGDPPRLTKYFLDLGLTSNRMLTASSQAQADNMVEAMRSTGYPATSQRPLYVFRTDLGGLTANHGTRWTNLVAQEPLKGKITPASGWTCSIEDGYRTGRVCTAMILCSPTVSTWFYQYSPQTVGVLPEALASAAGARFTLPGEGPAMYLDVDKRNLTLTTTSDKYVSPQRLWASMVWHI